jgi:hypothetical protein
VLGQATGNTDTQDSPWPRLGGSHHLPSYSIFCTSPRSLHPNGFSLPRLPQLWNLITLQADLGSRCGLKQSCSSRQELSNDMSHVVCSLVNRVDSRLFLVGSQTGILTPGLSFGHNLCFRCPNEKCEPILDIYVPRAFQWYKEHHKPLSFDPWNRSLKFWESTKTPSPKVGVALGVWGFTPSHFPTLLGACDVTPGRPLGSPPCNPFALVASPRLRLR